MWVMLVVLKRQDGWRAADVRGRAPLEPDRERRRASR